MEAEAEVGFLGQGEVYRKSRRRNSRLANAERVVAIASGVIVPGTGNIIGQPVKMDEVSCTQR